MASTDAMSWTPFAEGGDGPVVPVDLTEWRSGDPQARLEIARGIDAACSGPGFLAVTGHGVDPALMTAMLDVSQAFFDLPIEQKMRYSTEDLVGNRGYAPSESEALSYSLGVASPPDLFEAFNVGVESPPPGETDPAVLAQFFAPNIWPDQPAEMRQVWLDYFAACESLSLTLTDVFAAALGLPDGWFRRFMGRCPNVMRAVNYQRRADAVPAAPDQLRMGAHSDYGNLTILLADRVPGLQIRDDQGIFHDARPPEGGFLVNLGDLLAEWTNDRWQSTIHRVVPPPADTEGEFRRRSVAFFQGPDHDAQIDVLDVCCDDDHPPRYPPTTAGAHLLAKLMGPRTGSEVDVDPNFLD